MHVALSGGVSIRYVAYFRLYMALTSDAAKTIVQAFITSDG